MQFVLIGVCTAQRPQMLERCLVSLAGQLVDPGIRLEIVVIDNEPAPNNRHLVRQLADTSPIRMHYLHEHRRGIPFARNAVLDKGAEIGADWIAFIDDDEVAEPDWIAALMAEEYREIPVLMGQRVMVYPARLPFWAPQQHTKRYVEGQKMKTAYTHNVRFSMELVHAGLRYNESLGLMGGEDQEFFSEAHCRGFEIRRTLRAITHETAHSERLTFAAQCYQSYWCAASDMRRDAVLKGRPAAIACKAHTVLTNVIFGVAEIAASPAFLAAGRLPFKRRAVAGGKKLAKAAGRLAGMIGILPEPYRRVVGR